MLKPLSAFVAAGIVEDAPRLEDDESSGWYEHYMNERVRLSNVLIARGEESAEHLALFALINLGLIESLANGILTASDAVRLFYCAENCMFVRKHVTNKTADQIMSHGVQLPDLFEALPTEEAFREFQHELSAMRSLCLKILNTEKQVA